MDQKFLCTILGTRNEDTGEVIPAKLPVTGQTAREQKEYEAAMAKRTPHYTGKDVK